MVCCAGSAQVFPREKTEYSAPPPHFFGWCSGPIWPGREERANVAHYWEAYKRGCYFGNWDGFFWQGLSDYVVVQLRLGYSGGFVGIGRSLRWWQGCYRVGRGFVVCGFDEIGVSSAFSDAGAAHFSARKVDQGSLLADGEREF